MSNVFRSCDDTPAAQWLSMSNGATSVLMSTLGLSGSRLASTVEEKLLITWILEHDQSAVGIGTVGFSLSELPWRREHLEEQKQFLDRVLVGVLQESGWETLSYTPKISFIEPCIHQLREMIAGFEASMFDHGAVEEWMQAAEQEEPIRNGFPKCQRHQVFLTLYGCHVCNDGG